MSLNLLNTLTTFFIFLRTFTWPRAMVIAAAEVNPLMTGIGMKSTRKPATTWRNGTIMGQTWIQVIQ